MPESLRNLSIIAISKLTEAIHERFGLRVSMGAEVEYCAFMKKKTGKNADDPLGIPPGAKSSGEPAKYFESLPYVSSHYKEKPPNQYEVVLNHASFATPLQLAHAIDDIKGRIRSMGSARNLDISFAPAIDAGRKEGLTTNALHLNFSLLNSANENILGDNPNLAHYLLHRSMEVMQETIAIQAPLKESYDRFHKKNSGFEPTRFDHLHGMRLRTDTMPQGDAILHTRRLENRFPDADADPFATIAVTLAGVYYALSRNADLEMSRGVPTPKQAHYPPAVDRGPLPRTLREATQQLADSILMRTILNDLSPEQSLGNRFCEAAIAELKQGGEKESGRGWWPSSGRR